MKTCHRFLHCKCLFSAHSKKKCFKYSSIIVKLFIFSTSIFIPCLSLIIFQFVSSSAAAFCLKEIFSDFHALRQNCKRLAHLVMSLSQFCFALSLFHFRLVLLYLYLCFVYLSSVSSCYGCSTHSIISSAQFLDQKGRQGDMRNDSADILFQYFLQEALVSSSRRGWVGMSTFWCCPSSIFSANHGIACCPQCPEGWFLRSCHGIWHSQTVQDSVSWQLPEEVPVDPQRSLFLLCTQSLVLCSK